MHRAYFAVPLAAIVAGITGASPARANVRVGYAMLIEQNVSGMLAGQQRKIIKGDDVFENEFIRTEAASTARLLFVDKTQLVLGPTAVAKLDRLVFNPDRSVNTLTVSARAGAIRWISGDSVSSAYQIETSTVVIRPHGTAFDILVEPQRTTVLLQEGIAEVCLINASQRCRVLSRRGEMVTATPNAIEATQSGGPAPSDFEDRCLSAASGGCVYRTNANPPSGNPPSAPAPGPGQRRAEPRPPSNTPRQAYDPPQAPTDTSLAAVNPTTPADPIFPVMIPPSGTGLAPIGALPSRDPQPPYPGGGSQTPGGKPGPQGNSQPPYPGGGSQTPGGKIGTPNNSQGSGGFYPIQNDPPATGKTNNSQTPGIAKPPITRVPRPPSDGGKGTVGTKSTAGTSKYGKQMALARTGGSPRLHTSNTVKTAHASVKPAATPAMARSPGLRAASMAPKRAFALAGTGRSMGGMRMGGPRMGMGGRMFGGGLGGLFRGLRLR